MSSSQATNSTALSAIKGFSESQETFAVQETAATAAAAQSKALVEARYIMALRNPRDWDAVRQDLLKECRRPSFANNKSTWYVKPIGQGVEGLGIRFVEVALRCMKNVQVAPVLVFEDAQKEVYTVSVMDLESNLTYTMDVRVSKTVERSKPMDDGSYLSVRMNSYKKPVYTVIANDDDLLNKRGALLSKAIRTLGLRIIPGDLCDEAEEIIKAIRMDDAARDPDAARKKIVDSFSAIGVGASDLKAYLEHDIAQCSPAEIDKLRGIYGAIRDGEATWKSVMENKLEAEPKKDGDAKPVAQVCSQEEFDLKKPKWRELVTSKQKTPKDLIATIESKTKLSDEQKMIIDSWAHEND